MQQTDLAGKRLELLREIVPNLGRLGILIHVRNPGAVLDRGQVRGSGRDARARSPSRRNPTSGGDKGAALDPAKFT